MRKFVTNVVWLCGKPVQAPRTMCGTVGDLSDHLPATKSRLGIIPYLSDSLYYFCTHLLHSPVCIFTPVKTSLYPLSTVPTITITTNI